MMASRTAAAAGAQTSLVCAPRLLHSRPATQLHAMPPRSPSKLAGITASDPMSALGYFNKDLRRRRAAAPEINDQDNQAVRLSVPQASASALINTARERAEDGYSFTASGRTDIINWVELECLSLQASMEDMLVSMGSGEFSSDLGNGMQY